MLVTISVPDNTVGIYYSTLDKNDSGYNMESEVQKITFDMLVKVEQE